jgi:chorismate mutase
VPQSVPLCIRVLIHWNTAGADEIQHVYLKGAVKLRPDRVKPV